MNISMQARKEKPDVMLFVIFSIFFMMLLDSINYLSGNILDIAINYIMPFSDCTHSCHMYTTSLHEISALFLGATILAFAWRFYSDGIKRIIFSKSNPLVSLSMIAYAASVAIMQSFFLVGIASVESQFVEEYIIVDTFWFEVSAKLYFFAIDTLLPLLFVIIATDICLLFVNSPKVIE